MYWFAQILVLFHLRVPGAHAWSEDYVSVEYFDTTSPGDQFDHALNCVCFW